MKQTVDGLLSRLTDNPLQRYNALWIIVAGLFSTVGTVLVVGPVFETYLVKAGLSAAQIGIYGSVGQVTSAAGMFAFVGIVDRLTWRVRAAVILSLAGTLTPLALAGLSMLSLDVQTAEAVFAAVVALAIIQQPVASFFSMVYSSLSVRALHFNIRGRLTGIQGFTGGLLALAVGFAAKNILEAGGFPRGFTVCFAVAVPFYVACALSRGKMVELPELVRPGRSGSALPWAAIWDVLKVKEFRVLFGPNVLRGLSDGVVAFAWVMGLKRLSLPDAYAGWATMANAIAGTLLGTLAIALFVDRFGPGLVVFAANALTAVAMVCLAATNSPLVFLGFYALSVFGSTVMGSAVPLGTYEIGPPELMGAFSGARLMLLSAGTAISLPLVGGLLGSVDALPVFAGGAILKVAGGIWYWYGFRRTRRDPLR